MNQNTPCKKVEDRPDCAPAPASRAVRYAIYRAAYPSKTKRWCARQAGYATGSNTTTIENTLAVQAASQSVAQYREQLRGCPEASLGAMVVELLGLITATDGKGKDKRHRASDRDRIAAVKQVSSMLGYEAPDEVHVSSQSLIVELSGFSSDQLAAMKGVL
jgi:hypothetical protein